MKALPLNLPSCSSGRVVCFFLALLLTTFHPLARATKGTLFFIVNDHLGTPKEMADPKGRLVWSADHDTWGTLRHVKTWRHEKAQLQPSGQFGGVAMRAVAAEPDALLVPIRFQGQWEDAETGLYYNRFRYYEPGAGQYISTDPIGGNGGARNFGYVANPSFWVDPLGLKETDCSQRYNALNHHMALTLRTFLACLDFAQGKHPCLRTPWKYLELQFRITLKMLGIGMV